MTDTLPTEQSELPFLSEYLYLLTKKRNRESSLSRNSEVLSQSLSKPPTNEPITPANTVLNRVNFEAAVDHLRRGTSSLREKRNQTPALSNVNVASFSHKLPVNRTSPLLAAKNAEEAAVNANSLTNSLRECVKSPEYQNPIPPKSVTYSASQRLGSSLNLLLAAEHEEEDVEEELAVPESSNSNLALNNTEYEAPISKESSKLLIQTEEIQHAESMDPPRPPSPPQQPPAVTYDSSNYIRRSKSSFPTSRFNEALGKKPRNSTSAPSFPASSSQRLVYSKDGTLSSSTKSMNDSSRIRGLNLVTSVLRSQKVTSSHDNLVSPPSEPLSSSLLRLDTVDFLNKSMTPSLMREASLKHPPGSPASARSLLKNLPSFKQSVVARESAGKLSAEEATSWHNEGVVEFEARSFRDLSARIHGEAQRQVTTRRHERSSSLASSCDVNVNELTSNEQFVSTVPIVTSPEKKATEEPLYEEVFDHVDVEVHHPSNLFLTASHVASRGYGLPLLPSATEPAANSLVHIPMVDPVVETPVNTALTTRAPVLGFSILSGINQRTRMLKSID
ncbi:hypothetical protein RCL1_001623 [Eukaryota sp. TZLM3-RCL]